ncbi:amino acid permease, partial [Bacillus sp. mrc49]
IWVWSIILISHIIYTKKRPDLRAKSTFRAPLTPFINYLILGLFAFILLVMLFAEATRLSLLMTPIWFIVLAMLYKYKKR